MICLLTSFRDPSQANGNKISTGFSELIRLHLLTSGSIKLVFPKLVEEQLKVKRKLSRRSLSVGGSSSGPRDEEAMI